METKTHFTVSISKDLLSNFLTTACKKSINKSLLIENFLKDWIDTNKDLPVIESDVICKQHYANYNSSVKGDNNV